MSERRTGASHDNEMRILRPPYPKRIVDAVNVTIGHKSPERLILFKGRRTAFRHFAEHSAKYIEFGIGSSTIYASAQDHLSLFAVETDLIFVERVRKRCADRSNVQISHVDCGPVKAWGRPASYASFDNFSLYINRPTEAMPDADLVLIDGRWRVACFLHAMLALRPGCIILFDDYVSREHYAIVEEVVRPKSLCGNQAVFERPKALNSRLANSMLEHFRYVFD